VNALIIGLRRGSRYRTLKERKLYTLFVILNVVKNLIHFNSRLYKILHYVQNDKMNCVDPLCML